MSSSFLHSLLNGAFKGDRRIPLNVFPHFYNIIMATNMVRNEVSSFVF